MTALQRVAAERNVRSILFHLTTATAQRVLVQDSGAENAIRALKQHGYLLGLIGSLVERNSKPSVLDAFNVVHGDEPNGKSLYESVSKELKVPLGRSILVTEAKVTADADVEGPFPVLVLPQLEDGNSTPSLSQLVEDRDNNAESILRTSSPDVSARCVDLLSFDRCLDPDGRCFGPFRLLKSQVFDETELSFALVNLKPIVPGHVLVVPKRPVARFDMLDADEVSDLWTAAQRVGKQVERHYNASSLTFAIQDGNDAGQTVKHVHIHVIPRVARDFECNDDIYTEIEKHEQNLFVDNETRTARSEGEMAAEATELRPLFL